VHEIEAHAAFIAAVSFMFGIVGSGLLVYWSWKYVKQWMERRRSQRILEEFRRLRQEQDSGVDGDDVPANVAGVAACIICLTAPRDVVTLDCGHVCMCAECSHQLPEPRVCPVCRETIQRITPIYMP